METHGDEGLQSLAKDPRPQYGSISGVVGKATLAAYLYMYLVSTEKKRSHSIPDGCRRRIDITAPHLQAHGISMDILIYFFSVPRRTMRPITPHHRHKSELG